MSDSDLSVGSELFGYRVERLLGRGGMGVVYLCEDSRLRRPVALKLLTASLALDDAFRQRFLAEAELAASLDHPHVVPISAACNRPLSDSCRRASFSTCSRRCSYSEA
jgi:serine/threonine protein kinase